MSLRSLLRRSAFCAAFFALFALSIAPQESAPAPNSDTAQSSPAQPSGPAPIPMEEEQHHHLVFQNAYVKVFYVEIPAHDSTLYHHHDLPYISLPPPPVPDAPSPATAPNARPPAGAPVSYALGGFSHTVNNKSDVTLRNIAVELLRPQGNARNRCAQIIRDQPLGDCVKPRDPGPQPGELVSSVEKLFETDEIEVSYWEIPAGTWIGPAPLQLSALVGGMSGIVNVTLNGDARGVPQAGLIWLLPGSRTALEAGKDAPGRFVQIVFKDSALQQ